MQGFAKVFSLIIIILWISFGAIAQDKKDLQKERDRITEQINLTSKLIKETRETRNKAEGELSLINRKIVLREDLIRSIKREISLYNNRIRENKARIKSLEKELELLKENYAQMIRHAQRNNKAHDRLMYIFASHDFFQALKRVKYLNQIARFRHKQAIEIIGAQEELEKLNLNLLEIINEKDAVLQTEESTKQELARDLKERETAVKSMKQEESALLKKLQEQEKQREKLNKEIQRIIEAEIKASKKENAGVFSLTPEAAALSANFESNKGKLPWPVERGVITAKFGQNPHPVLAGITVPNNGIDIATSSNATVRSVFEGSVSAVFSIPGAGQNIIINHGGYRTVYSNVKEVFVKKGDKVSTRQPIGTVLTDESSGKTEAHLEIWKVSEAGTTKQDPALWILRQ
jgi:septal ring factor EnvC (AmiA/AmiB activator)